jgi:UDP-glucose 4-epimerase
VIILITGGAGFLGSALANQLVAVGHEVRVLDDLSAGSEKHLHPAVLFTRGDITDRPKLWTLLQDVECVYHLAARVSVPESVLYPREYNTVNVGGTVSVMEAMRDVGVRRVIFVSSGAVYGEQNQQPLRETVAPNPDSPYAVSKWAAEQYVRTIGKLWRIETVVLRVFNVYGPGQPLPVSHAPVIARFVDTALRGGAIVVNGDGRQTRDFVYVSDVVNALVATATAKPADGQIINIGSGQAVSMRDLIRVVGKAAGTSLEPIYRMQKSGGVSQMQADITMAHQLLGYSPQVSLEQGLIQIVQTMRRRLTANLQPQSPI